MLDQSKVVIELNPDLLSVMNSNEFFQETNMQRRPEVSFIGNRNLKPGECLVKAPDFYVDGTFSSQLDHIVEQLLAGETSWSS